MLVGRESFIMRMLNFVLYLLAWSWKGFGVSFVCYYDRLYFFPWMLNQSSIPRINCFCICGLCIFVAEFDLLTFVEYFCFNTHEVYQFMFLFWYYVSFWYGNANLMKWVRKWFFLCGILEDCVDCFKFLKCCKNLSVKQSGPFLFGKVL